MDYRRPRRERQTRRHARSSAFDRLTCTTQLRAFAIGEGKHAEKRPHRVRVRPWPDSACLLERVQFGEALLLFLLAGGFVAEVCLLFLGVGGGLSRCRAGLDVVDLIGGLGGLFRGGYGGVRRT